MCVQCMGTAVGMVGAATGIRAWIALRSPAWMTPRRLKAITAVLLTGAVVGSGIAPG